MDLDIYVVNASKLEDAIRSIPAVYPPELSFLGEKSITEAWIVRSMLSSRVYASPAAPYFAFSAKGGRCCLTLLVTKDSLASGLGQEDLDLLGELYRSGKRLTGQDHDVVEVAFPEDDFTTRRARRWIWSRREPEDWEWSMKSSGINAKCPHLCPLRCGLPKSFCNQLLAKFRRDKTSTTVLGDAIRRRQPHEHFKRGMDYLGRADFRSALEEFREAQRVHGDLPDDRSRSLVLIGLALSEWAVGNIPGAEAGLEAASRLSSSGSKLAAFVESCKKGIKQTSNNAPLLVAPRDFESREGIGFGDLVPVEVRVLTELFLKLNL